MFTNYGTLYVPAGTKAAYQSADYWQAFNPIIEMSMGGTSYDLNGDGKVNVGDVNILINKMHE